MSCGCPPDTLARPVLGGTQRSSFASFNFWESFMSTYFPKEGEIARKWFVVDASGQTLGRLASKVARILMGKENPKYTTFLDTGDHVIVINAEKVKTTGMKSEQKAYHRYTGYPGGLRSEDYRKRFDRKPELIIEDAISRMLPKNKLGKQMFTKLKVYRGEKHPHEAQKPEALVLG
jgi:large subunit ribosomal protein L13